MSDSTALGAYLRKGREASGLSLEVLSTRSRILPRLVWALEEGRSDALPAPVYVRGFIRAYCAEVGMDPGEALALYDAGIASVDPPRLVGAAPLIETAPRRRGRRHAVLAAGVAGAVLIGAAGATWLRTPREASPARGAELAGGSPEVGGLAPVTPAPASDLDGPVPVPSLPPTLGSVEPGARGDAQAPAPGLEPTAPPRTGGRVLVMRAEDATWVRVRRGDAGVTEEVLQPGTVREWRSAGPFTVTLGNAGGVRIELDGRPLPGLGARGQVVRDVVIPDGRAEPDR